MVDYLNKYEYRVALHVCGIKARKKLENKEIDTIIDKVQRIQVNGVLHIEEVDNICRKYPNHTVITQHDRKNIHLLSARHTNHALLVDASGGKGLTPTEWVAPAPTDKTVGFAGGLSPENINDEYQKIKLLAKDGHWLDMESSLRDESDWFDVERAIAVSDKFIRD